MSKANSQGTHGSQANPLLHAIAKIERFSPAPRILGRTMALLGDPNSSIEDISTLVKTDAALTAQIIRGANSAFYGAGGPVASLDEAVQKIGFRETVRLMNLLVAQVVSENGLNCYGITGDAFWTECLFNGLFMETLAQETNASEVGEAQTAGLLRYIGRLAIDQSIKDLGYGLFWDGTVPLGQWESENVGFSHTTAAGLLLRAWKFSDRLVNAIEWQNEPERAPAPSWLANALCFTTTILPPGAAIAISNSSSELAVPEIKETNFVLENHLTQESVKRVLEASTERFKSIRTDLIR